MTPFDVINNITASKTASTWEDIGDKDYNAFMVNRGLSYYVDCIMHANEVNQRYHLPKHMQYLYLHSAIAPKKKRFSKWVSSKKDKESQVVAEFFSVSTQKASTIRGLISDSEYGEIVAKMYQGGTT